MGLLVLLLLRAPIAALPYSDGSSAHRLYDGAAIDVSPNTCEVLVYLC